jgi:hypothetical protein
MNDDEMKELLIEYMGKGFLDNILALFRQDPSLCRLIPAMLGAESLHVRLGATALVEEFADEGRKELRAALPGTIALLRHDNPTIRGDAAAALGTIKDPAAIDALQACLTDGNAVVRELVQDALVEISGRKNPDSSTPGSRLS